MNESAHVTLLNGVGGSRRHTSLPTAGRLERGQDERDEVGRGSHSGTALKWTHTGRA